jgi:Na+/H+ antiporter NhaD/arsenite permease-like protein
VSKFLQSRPGYFILGMPETHVFAGLISGKNPALAILKTGEQGALAWVIKSVNTPAQYFWAAGSLSSFLDNAPTYLTFFNSALGKFYPDMPEAQAVAALIVEKIPHLAAISAGAVFMGANTYIGNAPNFMVKSIAEEAGIKMPSFFGYMFKYSIPILVVLFIIITFIFF